jgi:hypothetical protein
MAADRRTPSGYVEITASVRNADRSPDSAIASCRQYVFSPDAAKGLGTSQLTPAGPAIGNASEAAPPLPWADREAVLRRDAEIGTVREAMQRERAGDPPIEGVS